MNKNQKLTFLLMFFTIFAISAIPCKASPPDWSLTVTASNDLYHSSCTIGAKFDATDEFDTAYDIPAPPAPPTGMHTFLYMPDNPDLLQLLATSILASENKTGWMWGYEVTHLGSDIDSIGENATVTIRWDNRLITADFPATLRNGTTGQTLANMKNTDSYSFVAEQAVTYSFIITVQYRPTPDPVNPSTNPPPIIIYPSSPPAPSITPALWYVIGVEPIWFWIFIVAAVIIAMAILIGIKRRK